MEGDLLLRGNTDELTEHMRTVIRLYQCAEKIRREKSNKEVEKNDERVYNLGMSYGDDLPGLAG